MVTLVVTVAVVLTVVAVVVNVVAVDTEKIVWLVPNNQNAHRKLIAEELPIFDT